MEVVGRILLRRLVHRADWQTWGPRSTHKVDLGQGPTFDSQATPKPEIGSAANTSSDPNFLGRLAVTVL